jgi:hypothetical protein
MKFNDLAWSDPVLRYQKQSQANAVATNQTSILMEMEYRIVQMVKMMEQQIQNVNDSSLGCKRG